jgi:hypothetical protein
MQPAPLRRGGAGGGEAGAGGLGRGADPDGCAAAVGLQIGLVTWTVMAVINWCLLTIRPTRVGTPGGVSDWSRGPYWLSSIGVFDHTAY